LLQARIEIHPGAGEKPFAARLHAVDRGVDALGDSIVKFPVQCEQVTVPITEVVKKTPLGQPRLIDQEVHTKPTKTSPFSEAQPRFDELRAGAGGGGFPAQWPLCCHVQQDNIR
jgi:hypothetical protein